jgi:hypothetical protein
MKTITFTQKEINILSTYLWSDPCSHGCAVEKIKKGKNCDECEFTIISQTIMKKLGIIE